MNTGRPLLGAASGLLLAFVLIAGVSLGAGGSLHLDLIKGNGPVSVSTETSSQSGQIGGTAVAPQTGAQTAQLTASSSAPSSSLQTLTGHGGGSIGVLLLPIVLGAVLGALFYGVYSRRIDLE